MSSWVAKPILLDIVQYRPIQQLCGYIIGIYRSGERSEGRWGRGKREKGRGRKSIVLIVGPWCQSHH